MSKPKERIEYLDAVKGAGIIFVVFCHNVLLPKGSILGNYLMALAWLAVPCFMMVSGALSHQKKSLSLKLHFKKLGIMYLSFCAWRAIHVILCYAIHGLKTGLKGIFQFIFLFQTSDEMFSSHMWYIYAYFFVMLLFPITYCLFQNKDYNGIKGRKILFYIMCLCWICRILVPALKRIFSLLGRISPVLNVDISGLDLILPFGDFAHMMFYFIAGAFLFEYREKIAEKVGRKKVWFLPICLLAGVGMVVIKAIDKGTFTWNDQNYNGGYTWIMTSIMAIAAYLFFTSYADKFKRITHFLAKYIGPYTLGIYYLHRVLLLPCVYYIYPHLEHLESVWLNLVKTIVITFLCIVLTVLMRKIPVIRRMVS